MRIATSMTSLGVNVLETVFVPLITELLRLAKPQGQGPLPLMRRRLQTNKQQTNDRRMGFLSAVPADPSLCHPVPDNSVPIWVISEPARGRSACRL